MTPRSVTVHHGVVSRCTRATRCERFFWRRKMYLSARIIFQRTCVLRYQFTYVACELHSLHGEEVVETVDGQFLRVLIPGSWGGGGGTNLSEKAFGNMWLLGDLCFGFEYVDAWLSTLKVERNYRVPKDRRKPSRELSVYL